MGFWDKKNKVICVEKDLDNFPCPTEKEMIKFLQSFEYLDKCRLCFELMMISGARVGEATKARLQEFDKDFTLWKYRIQKPKINMTYNKLKRESITTVDYKVRTVNFPEWFSKKLKQFFEENKYSMDRGFIFYNRNHDKPYITSAMLRNILVKKRRLLNLLRVWKIVARENADPIKYYVLNCHSFRRFYIGAMFKQFDKGNMDNALVKVGKLLGHSTPLKTTSIYLSPRAALDGCDTTFRGDFLK